MPKPNLHAVLLSVACISVSGARAQVGTADVDTRSAVGLVRQVAGDLAYVEGLNGSAALWDRLRVVRGDGTDGGNLEVIKELDRVIVARVLSDGGAPVKVSDRVIRVEGPQPSGPRSRRVVYATRVDNGPELDGRLDDPAWQEAHPIEGFVQREPDYWIPATESIVARIVYDRKRIYFGFECASSQPERLVANNMRRDSEIHGDENIQILLDTYNDRRTGFFFFVNPLGARRDLILSNEGRTYNADWDCIWEAKTGRHAQGWTAEIAIPFDQLRFKTGKEMVWGINLARHISHRHEEVQLVVGRRSSTSLARYWTSDLGELVGLESIRAKRLLQIKPYVLPSTSIDRTAPRPEETPSFETGVDVRYGITPNLALDISYNTDFAQVEGDQEQVNLTQFKLFFPEKREFFLEGANLFDFGEAAERRGGETRPPTLLFYSRRIGLEDKKRVPIVLGTKLAGKVGRTSIGLLNVLTDSEHFRETDNFGLRSNFSVARVKRDLFARSNVGFIFVNKQRDGPASGWRTYNRAGGIDFSLSPTVKLNMQGFVARTWDSGTRDTDDARFLQFGYSGDLVSGRLNVLDVEDKFEPAVGFVNRRKGMDDIRRYSGQLRLRPRPRVMNIRYLFLTPSFQLIADLQNRVKSWEGKFSWWAQFNTGDYFQFIEGKRQHEVVEQAFKPSGREDIEIPPGSYTSTTFSTGLFTSRGRNLRVRLKLEAGGYYIGHRYRVSLESVFRPTGRFSLETKYETNWIRLPVGNLNLQTLSNRLIYSFTTDFFVKLFAQWNNDKELVSANFLINYRFRPGSDLFFVYDQAFGTEGGLAEQNRAVLLKLAYLIGL